MNDYYKNIDTAAISNSDSNCTVGECENTELTYYSADDTDNEHTQQGSNFAGLEPILKSLDQRLEAAVRVSDKMFAARSAGDLYRGLAITPADVAAALQREPGQPLYSLSAQLGSLLHSTQSLSLQRLQWLQQVYDLTEFDIDVIIIALAPEIDLRYERLYAYLQDDVAKRKPGIDLALNLLCANANEKLRQRERFAPDAPIVRHQLIEIYVDPHHTHSPLLARYYKLDEQIVRLLLLDDGLDSRLASFCKMRAGILEEDAPPLTDLVRQRILASSQSHRRVPVRLYFHGPAECGQLEASKLLAELLEKRVLLADLHQITGFTSSATQAALSAVVREAWYRGAVLHVRNIEQDPAMQLDVLWKTLSDMPVNVVIEGQCAWVPSVNKPKGVATVNFTYPDTHQRKQWWAHCLGVNELTLSEENISLLAQRYRMTYAQIQDAVAVAAASDIAVQSNSVVAEEITANIVFTAARHQCGHDLALLASKVEARATWDDLILTEDATEQLRELCNRFIYRDKVLYEWGFAKKLSYGLGIIALFTGGPGTGKTMAAEVIANALGLDLYKIDLAQVVSKYIGETEKNLDKVFTAATNANAILFFDEADALFGKRTEVKDSHDRYANLEISYLLQKMEQYEGITILATNLSNNMDQAFTRRLTFKIHFEFPNDVARKQLWERAWPQVVPVSEYVNRQLLARELKIAGGNIKNIAISSVYFASANGGEVGMEHIEMAVQRECVKMGIKLLLSDRFKAPPS